MQNSTLSADGFANLIVSGRSVSTEATKSSSAKTQRSTSHDPLFLRPFIVFSSVAALGKGTPTRDAECSVDRRCPGFSHLLSDRWCHACAQWLEECDTVRVLWECSDSMAPPCLRGVSVVLRLSERMSPSQISSNFYCGIGFTTEKK